MKDIYELLNDSNIDITEFDEIEVNELEKKKVKRALKQSINNKKKTKSWKRNVAAASMIIVLSFTTFGITFPAYASNIPVIGDIFSFFNHESTGNHLYDHYQEYSTEMNLTQESEGIKVTINDAIYDGNTVSLAYSIESERDLGENLNIHGIPKFKESKGMVADSKIVKVDEHHYVGLFHATDPSKNGEDTVYINWNLENIIQHDTQVENIGDWNFNFSLQSTGNKIQLIHQDTEQDGVKVTLGKLAITPMSFTMYYDIEASEKVSSTWHDVDVALEIKDNLGNRYSGEGNGGTGKDSYHMSWSKTFQKLDPNATQLIVTPHVTLRSYTFENHGSVEMNRGRESKEIPIPKKSGVGQGSFALQDILIDLKK